MEDDRKTSEEKRCSDERTNGSAVQGEEGLNQMQKPKRSKKKMKMKSC